MSENIHNLIRDINAKGSLFRTGTLEAVRAEDGKTVEGVYEISFSSEIEVERWFGVEVLGHKTSEVRMDWLKSSSAPLLLQHDPDQQIGVVESAKIEERRGTARVRFGKSTLAREVEADVAAGIRKNVSVGYRVHNMVLTKQEKDGKSASYRVTDWEPSEISIVSVPADRSVGTDRSQPEPHEPNPKDNQTMKNRDMRFHNPPEGGSGAPAAPAAPTIDFVAERKKLHEAEATRLREIEAIATAHRAALPEVDKLALKARAEGLEIGQLRADIVEAYRKKQESLNVPGHDGLSRQEQKDLSGFGWAKALRQLANGGRLDGVEAEMHQEGVREFQATGRAIAPNSLILPLQVLRFNPAMLQKRSTITTVSGLVPTDISTDFITALRGKIVCVKNGTRFIGGLQGNVPFPKMTTGGAFAWLAETGSASDASAVVAAVTASPKRIGGYVPLSNQFLMQSGPDIENLIREDIAGGVAVVADAGVIAGTGSSNQPTGILYTNGIGSVVGGTNGAAPDWADIIDLEQAVGVANGDIGSLRYVTNPKVRGKLKKTAKVSSTDSVMVWSEDNRLNGYEAAVTTSVPSNLDKGTSTGVCSAIVFGNMADTILAQWGGLMVTVDPYSSAGSNITNYHVNAYFDVIVRRAASFAAMLDATTT